MEVAEPLTEYEQERGKPMPSTNHAVAQFNLILALQRYKDRYSILPELSLELAGRPLVPDISIYPKLAIDWRHDEVKKTEPPLMVIEILSPKQSLDEVVRKADAYLEGGVQSCWVVQPVLETIAVLLPGEKPKVYSTGEVTDPPSGITVKLEEVFQ
jgi:Uma2 family endonuclease